MREAPYDGIFRLIAGTFGQKAHCKHHSLFASQADIALAAYDAMRGGERVS